MTRFGKELVAMKQAAREASRVALRFQKKGFGKRSKNDASPVTQADIACENTIRSILSKAFPAYGFFGEEESHGSDSARRKSASRRFIVDPIDGTTQFILGLPSYGTMIGLEVDGDIVAGVVAFPATGDVYWAEKAHGAFKNGGRIRVSKTTRLSDATVLLNARLPVTYNEKLFKFGRRPVVLRTSDMIYPSSQLWQGKLDAIVMGAPWPWDIAACKIILEEAGGRMTDQRGKATIYQKPGFYTLRGDFTVYTNGALHAKLLKALFSKHG